MSKEHNLSTIDMTKKPDQNLITGLDIGTTKVAAIIAEINEEGEIEVIGIGNSPSRGLKKGVVVNLEATVQSITRAVEEAELMADCQIHSVSVGIAGSHIKSLNSDGVVAIKDKEVKQSDVERVIESAKAVAIPADQKILHVIPQEFIIDRQEGIREPIGMSGIRLEAQVHMVTGAASAAQNIIKCVRRCGLEVDEIILEQLASSDAVLTEDEKELGVCLIDIGGGTTDLAIHTKGAIRHTAVFPIAGDQVTNDIALALRTPTAEAEKIKIAHGTARAQTANIEGTIEVPGIGDRSPRLLSHLNLAEIIEPRYEELMQLVYDELRRNRFDDLIAAGIVLSGGSAQVNGLVDLAEEVFQMPVRLGTPQNLHGLANVTRNPIYSTGIGLLLMANENRMAKERSARLTGGISSLGLTIKSWFLGKE